MYAVETLTHTTTTTNVAETRRLLYHGGMRNDTDTDTDTDTIQPYDDEYLRQTSGSRALSNRTLLIIMVAFIVIGAVALGGPVVVTMFHH